MQINRGFLYKEHDIKENFAKYWNKPILSVKIKIEKNEDFFQKIWQALEIFDFSKEFPLAKSDSFDIMYYVEFRGISSSLNIYLYYCIMQ